MKINSSCSLVFAPFSTCKLRLQFPELPAAPDWERHAARPLRNVVSKVVYIYRDSTSEEHLVTINSDCGPAHKLQPERRRRKVRLTSVMPPVPPDCPSRSGPTGVVTFQLPATVVVQELKMTQIKNMIRPDGHCWIKYMK